MRAAIRDELEFWLKVDGFIDFVCGVAIMAGGSFLVVCLV